MLGHPLQEHQSLASTNLTALAWQEAPHGAAVLAHNQTGGRGRLGRNWSSPAGKGLYLSVVLRPPAHVDAAQISLTSALAAAYAVRQVSGLAAQIKWPNDILVADSAGQLRKIGGILCEARAEDCGSRVVVGLGLNLNHQEGDLPERIQFPASSLLLLTGKNWSVEDVLTPLLAQWTELDKRLKQGAWPEVLQEINGLLMARGEAVKVEGPAHSVVGMLDSVDIAGRLVLRTAEGLQSVTAGDVSLF